MGGRAGREWLRIATPLLSGVAVASACLAGYLELAEDLTISPAITAFDARLGGVVLSWRSAPLTSFMRAVTWTGDTLATTLGVLAAVAVLLWLGRRREALLTAFVVAAGSWLGGAAKRVTRRPRPPAASALIALPTSFSFPSGHSLAALLLWTAVAFATVRVTARPWIRALVLVSGVALIALVGTSRVYLGAHWPSDVVASWLLGVAWLSVTMGAFLSWERL